VSRKSENILNSLRSKSSIRLNWTHYRIILQEKNKEARDWYEQEAVREIEQQKEFFLLQHKED
jgi:hypothetical protein